MDNLIEPLETSSKTDELLLNRSHSLVDRDQVSALNHSPSRPARKKRHRSSVTTLEDEGDDELRDLSLPYDEYSTIDWMRDWMREYRYKHRQVGLSSFQRFIRNMYESAQSWIVILLTGIFLGLTAAFIDIAAAWLTDIKQGVCSTQWYLSKDICCKGLIRSGGYCDDFKPWSLFFVNTQSWLLNFIVYAALSVLFAGICAFLVERFAHFAAGSGTAEIKTILGGFVMRGFLGIKTLLIKVFGLPLVVASGLAVGKEGPMIHVACALSNVFLRIFPKIHNNEAKKREILSAAAAAGVAVAFGSPIGGVLFSLEELSTFFPTKTMIRAFFCALVSIVTLQVVDPYRGKRVLYQVTYSRNWYFFEMIFFVILGIFGGMVGALLMRCSLWVKAFRAKNDWIVKHPVTETALIAGVTALVGYLNIFTRIDSSELLEYLFKECDPGIDSFGLCEDGNKWSLGFFLLIALLAKCALTTVALGCRVPAGVFIPSMVFGALFGRTLGIIIEAAGVVWKGSAFFSDCPAEGPCVTPGMYALLGAMACLGGVTKMTVSLTVIMFELTGTLNYIIPCMVTVMVAKLVGDCFGQGGMTEIMIRVSRYPFLDPREDTILGVSVRELMTSLQDLTCLVSTGMSLGQVERILGSNDFQGFPIITSYQDPNLLGYITRSDLLYALGKVRKVPDVPDNVLVCFEEPLINTQLDSVESTSPLSPGSVASHRGRMGSARLIKKNEQGIITSLLFSSYVDHTPLAVDPRVPVEFVMDLFKKLGPRIVLMKSKGRLSGLITKKDLLQYIYSSKDVLGYVGLRVGPSARSLFEDPTTSTSLEE